ncbi:unnamed protein product, partial [Pipistrellus nathusii]
MSGRRKQGGKARAKAKSRSSPAICSWPRVTRSSKNYSGGVTIAQGGVLTKIQAVLLPKKRRVTSLAKTS